MYNSLNMIILKFIINYTTFKSNNEFQKKKLIRSLDIGTI